TWQQHCSEDPDPRSIGLLPTHLAYVIYTSGSTGQPKGVMIEHENIPRLVLSANYVDLCPNDAVLQISSLSFDISTFEIFGALLNGARLVIHPDGPVDLERLRETIQSNRVTVAMLATPLFHQAASEDPHIFDGMKQLLAGGDVIAAPDVNRVFAAIDGITFANAYGPSEATTLGAANRISKEGAPHEAVPIGRPVSNGSVYLLDRELQPVPRGAIGEIFLGGHGIGRGYLGRPELTKERFLDSPFVKGDRLYRTGDLGRHLSDGKVEYLGRDDFQVKILGFRVEPGEVESALLQHPLIREAVVVAREHGMDDKQLVAYYTTTGPEEPGVEALRAYLLPKFPKHMVPAAYVQLSAMPLTPSAKLDRKALPAPDERSYGRATSALAPTGEMELQLAQLWSEVLLREQIGRHDNFFDLGGHSLLAVKLLARIHQDLHLRVTLQDLFTQPTLSEFGLILSRLAAEGAHPLLIQDRSAPLKLSFSQLRLWFMAQMEGGDTAYHISLGVRLGGELIESALQHALDRLLVRHEVLRTSFEVVDGEVFQKIASEQKFLLVRHDVSALEQPQERVDELVGVYSSKAFDLRRGPLIRGCLIRRAPQDHVLLLSMHHIVVDGWSVGILSRELSTLYQAYAQGLEDPLRPLAVQYADYAAWQRRWLMGAVLTEQVEFWRETLSGAPALLELRTDHKRPAQQSFEGALVDLEIDEALTVALRALSRRQGTTLFMTVLTAWALVLSRLSGQQDLVIGVPSANRARKEIEGLIGFFVNTLALRIDLSGSPTLEQLLQRVKLVALAAQDHRELPFEQVVDLIKPARSLAHTPIFQTMFAWQSEQQAKFDWPGMSAEPVRIARKKAKFDLTLSLAESGGRIVGGLEYATALFDRQSIERFGGYLRRVLSEMVSEIGRVASSIPMLSDQERHQLLVQWNETAVEYPRDQCVHQLFEAQVRRDAKAIAIVYENQTLSYAELNAQANQLAHRLRELGVIPDSRVGICIQRSPEMVIGLLAILKAGAAYVPLDPGYPSERLAFMLSDSAPLAVLTHEPAGAALQAAMAALSPQPALLNLSAPTWQQHCSEDPDPRSIGLLPTHLAYVIYTSGSTGQPKGVMIEHENLVNYLGWALTAYRVGQGAGAVVNTSVSFDSTITSLYLPLLCGRTVVLVREVDELEELELQLQRRPNLSLVKISPTHLNTLGQRFRVARPNLSLAAIVVGGETLLPSTVELWQSIAPTIRLINEYGPTETVVGCSYFDIPVDWDAAAAVPIGRPIANTKIYVLDLHQQPVPIGVVGEIYIGGSGLARGYWNRPELSRERFVQDPFNSDPAARLYRTGDLGRWSASANLEFLGRNDRQVKIRGYRIELEEIEAQLLCHPKIAQAAVLTREDSLGEKQLLAYYICNGAGHADASDLREHMRSALPKYMLPVAYVPLESFPMTPNGKLDRAALAPPGTMAYGVREYEAPEGEVEQVLAEIWLDLLAIGRVGRLDHFFDLGGHSLLALQMISRVEHRFQIEVPIRLVFMSPELAQLAARIDGLRHARLRDQLELGGDTIEDLLESVSSMSDAAAREMLRRINLGTPQ
ncbi:MAG TPA: amino acid adenylation domain-containing protein, partial [Steroidobacteraceae bacterium]|nr:amino acid adenylation domain-containing protein [Steroidobacteraceae bacterium]